MQVQKAKLGFKLVNWHYHKIIEIPESWDVERLGKLCKLRKNGKIESNLYVGLEHIAQGSNTLEGRGNVSEFRSTKNEFHKGDVLYGKLRPKLNKVWLATESGCCSTDVLPIVASQKIVNRMLLLILSNHYFYSYAVGTSAGTKMPRTNWPDIKKFKVFLPPTLSEQQKIASVLSTIDDLINKFASTIEYTKKLKTGLMQRLLTKGIGHTKFKKIKFLPRHIELEIPQEWNSDTLENILIKQPQNGINKKLEEYGTGVPIFEIDSLYRSDFIIDQINLRCVDVNADELLTYKLYEDDFVINRVSKVKEGVGKLILVSKPIKNLIYEGNTIRFSIDSKIVLPRFFKFLSETKLYFNYIQSTCKTTSLTSIDQEILDKIPVLIPSTPEQKKIIQIFSKLDSKIFSQESKKSNLEILKKSLMQKLLTGQLRV